MYKKVCKYLTLQTLPMITNLFYDQFSMLQNVIIEISLNENAKQSFQINKLTLSLAFSSQLIANKNICKH